VTRNDVGFALGIVLIVVGVTVLVTALLSCVG
jgi:hypothetical protein